MSADKYNTDSGAYIGTVSTLVNGSTIIGEFVQIQLPYTLYVTSYSVKQMSMGGQVGIICFQKASTLLEVTMEKTGVRLTIDLV